MTRPRRWFDPVPFLHLSRMTLIAALTLPMVGCIPRPLPGRNGGDHPADDPTTGVDPEDADAPKPPTASWDPELAPASRSYMDLKELLASEQVDDFEWFLVLAMEYLVLRHIAGRYFVGVEQGWTGEGPGFWLDPQETGPFVGDNFQVDPTGMYTVTDLAVVDDQCATSGIEPGRVFEQGDAAQDWEGICAPLSVLHSLVDQLHVVSEDWDGVVDGDNWAEGMVRAVIRQAGGDPDDPGDRAPSVFWGEIDDAHTAPWNADYDLVSKTDGDWIAQPTGDCDDLREWCEQMETFVEGHNDDCIVGVYGGTLDGEDVGHAMVVYNSHGADEDSAVEFVETATSCYCEVKLVDTSRQDTDGDCVVPRNPGKQLWRFYPDDMTVAASDNGNAAFFNGVGFTMAEFQCWDEDPKPGVEEGAEGQPGEAMPGE
jgi:hypothetical protein